MAGGGAVAEAALKAVCGPGPQAYVISGPQAVLAAKNALAIAVLTVDPARTSSDGGAL